MKNYKIVLGLAAGLLISPIHAADMDALTKEARGVTMKFGKALKGELIGAMKSGGPVKALNTCNAKAPVITKAAGDNSGWDVARTSLKLRNTGNAPDAWEMDMLNQFEARRGSGEDIKKMEAKEIVTVNGQKTFRYMKAIPTGKPCMACHAAEVAPPIADKLKELYPDDKARGYTPGMIRGAFTLSKKL